MRKIPMRTCIACRSKKSKKDMVRILLSDEEGLMYDLSGKKNGRGAYICLTQTCLDALKKGALENALKTQISDADFEALKASLGKEVRDTAM